MNALVTPDDRLLEEIFRGTVQEWSGGLDFERYAALQREVLTWASARERYRYRALVDADGRLLSSFKAYRFAAQWGGRAIVALGVGAVFTPPNRRRSGHAAELLALALDEACADGARAALLFSDIGPGYYAKLGFATVASSAVDTPVQSLPEPSAECAARDASVAELPRLAAMLAARPVGAAFALSRTAGTVSLLYHRMARAIAAHGVDLGPAGALAPRGAALWVGFPGRALTVLDFYAEDEASRAGLLMRARAAAERLECNVVNAWAVGGVSPFGAPKERASGVPMIASLGPIGVHGPMEAVLAGLDHF